MPQRSKGPRQPRKRRKLSKELITREAFKLADKKGLEGLSMRSLATSLGVEAMSLYNHVSNKDEILDAIVDEVFRKIKWDNSLKDWRQAMTQRAISTRDILMQHPWVIKILESRDSPGPNTLAHHDAVISCLRAAKFSMGLTAAAFSALDSYTYGFIMTEQTLPFETEDELRETAQIILSSFPKEAYPHLFEFTSDYVLQPSYSYQKEFLNGLSLILDSLQQRLKSETN